MACCLAGPRGLVVERAWGDDSQMPLPFLRDWPRVPGNLHPHSSGSVPAGCCPKAQGSLPRLGQGLSRKVHAAGTSGQAAFPLEDQWSGNRRQMNPSPTETCLQCMTETIIVLTSQSLRTNFWDPNQPVSQTLA